MSLPWRNFSISSARDVSEERQLHPRFWNFFKDPEKINERQGNNEAIGLFQIMYD
jgi:hypothetical protein